MVIYSMFALAAAAAAPVFEIEPVGQDRLVACPVGSPFLNLLQLPAEAKLACIQTTANDASPSRYAPQLKAAGWVSEGGEANSVRFRRDSECLGISGLPSGYTTTKATDPALMIFVSTPGKTRADGVLSCR